jgi:serine/threonine protein kinase
VVGEGRETLSHMSEDHLVSLQPGTVIAGRYEVVRCLGAGSMGLVYACQHKDLAGHLVAVKVLFPEVARDKVAAARFNNEIFASYGVSHPNVVRAYEYLRDGDLVAYTMEYISGGDLADRLARPDSPIPLHDVVDILSQMCLGVQAIHDAGIVHRDLKPENILLTKDKKVKIADFGIARTDGGPKLTEHGGVVGTIDYVSPEYMLNSHVDWRSDIYAMGILAYEMVAGESPFKGDSVYATMTKRIKTDPKPPSSLRPDCPAALDAIILKAMARSPDLRYQSAGEMFFELQLLPLAKGANYGSSALRMTRQASAAYEGPTLEAERKDTTAGPSARTVFSEDALPARKSTGTPRSALIQPPDMVARPKVPDSVRKAEAYSADLPGVITKAGMRRRSGKNRDRQTTEIVGGSQADTLDPSEAENSASFDVDLSRNGRSLSPKISWSQRHPRRGSLGGGDLDQSRIRRLSEFIVAEKSSVWVDILLWGVTILVGVAIGFLFLKFYLPDLLA